MHGAVVPLLHKPLHVINVHDCVVINEQYYSSLFPPPPGLDIQFEQLTYSVVEGDSIMVCVSIDGTFEETVERSVTIMVAENNISKPVWNVLE